ncbi:hypothetical protein [Gracilibacillus thailandensis]|uniref:Uncharacterized protein n=1 Tax=Gracilibacillus thailandensis TaxID=563735 RepID=A0A6N7R3Y0_9BACI|nr:hypothetical protein [Gracilibacillus thailandensis]MRI67925.1 hypothetical protein [Gracilibacillus thailandensis]
MKKFKNLLFNSSNKHSEYLEESNWDSNPDDIDDLDIEYEFEGFINKNKVD